MAEHALPLKGQKRELVIPEEFHAQAKQSKRKRRHVEETHPRRGEPEAVNAALVPPGLSPMIDRALYDVFGEGYQDAFANNPSRQEGVGEFVPSGPNAEVDIRLSPFFFSVIYTDNLFLLF